MWHYILDCIQVNQKSLLLTHKAAQGGCDEVAGRQLAASDAGGRFLYGETEELISCAEILRDQVHRNVLGRPFEGQDRLERSPVGYRSSLAAEGRGPDGAGMAERSSLTSLRSLSWSKGLATTAEKPESSSLCLSSSIA